MWWRTRLFLVVSSRLSFSSETAVALAPSFACHLYYTKLTKIVITGELESTTSARVRYLAQELSKEQTKLPHFLRPPEPDHPGPSKVEEIRAMVGAPVAKWIIKNKIGEKMSGSERWTATDKEFELFSGLEKSDQGYEKDARRKPKRLMEKEELLSNPGATQHIVTHRHDFELLC